MEFIYRRQHLKIGYMSYIKNSQFSEFNTLHDNVQLVNSRLGKMTYIASGSTVQNTSIGAFCSIGPGCRIGLGTHPTKDYVSTHPAFFSASKQSQVTFADHDYFIEHQNISIGNDVWIGANVIIIDGVTIGNGAIIAAGAVVAKDIPPFAIAGGIPAKVIRFRFDPTQIEAIQKSKWWENEIQNLRQNFKQFHHIDIFLKKF